MTDSSSPVRAADGGVLIDVWVVPGSSRPGVDGLHGGRVRVRVAAPPEGGRANREAARLVAAACGARRGRVVAGGSGRSKVVHLPAVARATAAARLRELGIPV